MSTDDNKGRPFIPQELKEALKLAKSINEQADTEKASDPTEQVRAMNEKAEAALAAFRALPRVEQVLNQGNAVKGEKVCRQAEIIRETKETYVNVELNLDGGQVEVNTDIGFFDHMLYALATYAGWGFRLECNGDLEVDAHHTVEDVGLVLGEAMALALGDYSGHARFGSSLTPMDDALAEAAVDVGRRPFLHFQVDWPQPVCGSFELCLVEEFWRAVCQKGGLTLHLIGRHGANSHHLAEAVFKGAGRALAQALAPRPGGVLSTKGVL